MAIILNDNIKINAGKPSESKYLTTGNTAYASVTSANALLPVPVRYNGLTVLVNSGGTNIEYWYKDGVADINLIEKKYDSTVPIGDFVTGGTNVGYFSGFTGIQTLPIDNMTDNTYDGNYNSLYNYFYRGTDFKIHTGTPSDNIAKRGYLKSTGQVKSWIWNEGLDYSVGWIFVDGDVTNLIGINPTVSSYYNGVTTFPYTTTAWVTGSFYNNGSTAVINTVLGSLTTGSTYTNGAPVFAGEVNNVLNFKTIQSKTPDLLKITADESLIYFSGKTPTVLGSNVGIGVDVYKDTTINISDTTLNFRTIVGGGNTVVTQSGDTIVIFSSGGTGGSGDTYNLASPAAICVGGICAGTSLVGKTSFELFEELLVPTLYPVLTNPSSSMSLSPSGTFEVGCHIPLCILSCFDAGCINPQFTATCSKRSNGVNLYCLTGTQTAPGAFSCTSPTFTFPAGTYELLYGTQTWGSCQHYNCGVQPKDSKSYNYCSPLIAGETSAISASLTGIYPYYYGKLVAGSRPAVTNSLVTGGTKVVADSSGTVTVSFNSSTSEYTWLAIPYTATAKTCWYVNALDNGHVNCAPSDKYPDECLIGITSGQGCWSGINYKVYMSGTVGAISAPMEFRNS
jgi:hypothetical protein